MALWILQNQYTAKVLADLRTICPDPGLTIDPAGKVSYRQTMSSIGCDTLALLQQRGTVAIRGESSNWSARPIPGRTLADIAGVAVYDTYPGTQLVDIVYDASECNGRGFVTVDPQGVLITLTSDTLLFHELAHAAQFFLSTYNPADPEPGAISAENLYRANRGLPMRGGWAGGCRGSYTPGPTVPGTAAQSVAPSVITPLLLLEAVPQAIGTTHTFPVSALSSGESTYHINVNNQTTDTFTQIVVFYKRIGMPGVVFLKDEEVQPTQVVSFMCGLCKELESYVVGFFIGDELVAQIPATGNMTPGLASQLNPTDRYPCVDSWMIS